MRGLPWLAALAAAAPGAAQVEPLEIQSLTPPSGSGYTETFRLTAADGGDGSSVASVGIYVTGRFDLARTGAGCFVYWDRNADAFFLSTASGCKATSRHGSPRWMN